MVTTIGPVFTYLVYGGLGVAAVCGTAYYGSKVLESIKEKQKNSPAARRAREEKDRKYQEYEEYLKSVSKKTTVSETVKFRNAEGQEVAKNFEIAVDFDESKDKMYRGRLYYYKEDGSKVDYGDVYLFQPRLLYYGKTKTTEIVPNDLLGYLDSGRTYQFRKPNDKSVYYGYVPKREVLTGEPFDYVLGESRFCINATNDAEQKRLEEEEFHVRSLIDIIVPKDSNGNLIPVDMNDPKERKRFEEYVKKHRPNGISSQFKSELRKIVEYVRSLAKKGYTNIAATDRVYADEPAKKAPAQTQQQTGKKRPAPGYEHTIRVNNATHMIDDVMDDLDRMGVKGNRAVVGSLVNADSVDFTDGYDYTKKVNEATYMAADIIDDLQRVNSNNTPPSRGKH